MYYLGDADSPEVAMDKLKFNHHRNQANQKVKSIIKTLPQRRAAISEVRQIEINDYVEMPSLSKKKQEKLVVPEKVKGAIWSKMTE